MKRLKETPPEEWEANALCAQTDPEIFFPEKGGSTREAKKTCARCMVAAECLDKALANDERFGIWGGLSERERRKLVRQLGVRPVCSLLGCDQNVPVRRKTYCSDDCAAAAHQAQKSASQASRKQASAA